MIVLAVDPGKVTGWATWSDGDFNAGQLGRADFLRWADELVPMYAVWDLHVVVEDFRITQQTLTKGREAHWAMGQIGCLEWWCEKYEVPFTKQTPADAKRFVDDRKLRRVGWFESTPGGHRNDACRHLLLYLVKHGRVELGALV